MGRVFLGALDVHTGRKGVNPHAACTCVRLTLAPKSAKWQENNIRGSRRQCLGWSGGLQPWVEDSKGTGGNLLPAAPARQHRSHCQRHRHRSHRRPAINNTSAEAIEAPATPEPEHPSRRAGGEGTDVGGGGVLLRNKPGEIQTSGSKAAARKTRKFQKAGRGSPAPLQLGPGPDEQGASWLTSALTSYTLKVVPVHL